MLSDLSKEIGVILFTNTSLCDQEMEAYFAVFDELWKYAVTLKNGEQKASSE